MTTYFVVDVNKTAPTQEAAMDLADEAFPDAVLAVGIAELASSVGAAPYIEYMPNSRKRT